MKIACAVVLGLTSIGLAGCGSTKTVTETVSPSSTSTSTSTTAPTAATTTPTTATTASGPPSCQSATKPSDVNPVVCQASNGTYFKVATENHPIRLKTLTIEFVGAHSAPSVSTGNGGPSATASGTFEIITLRVTNNTTTPQTVESIGGDYFNLETLDGTGKTFSESFQAENQADQNAFISNDSPIQPGGAQTGDIVFDLPASGLIEVRKTGAGLVFGDFGTDLSSANASNAPSAPFGLMIIHHIRLQG